MFQVRIFTTSLFLYICALINELITILKVTDGF
jgi:hypothetical protein